MSRLGEGEEQLRRPPDGGSPSPSRNAAYYAFSSDRACADHLPGCPRCGDLSDPGAVRCEGCNSPLLDDGRHAKAKPTLAQLAEVVREDPIPEPERSVLARYWLEHYSAEEIAEFVAGLE